MTQHTMEEEIFTGKIDLALWRKLLTFAWPYRVLFCCLISLGISVAVWDTLLPRIAGLIVDAVTAQSQSGLHRHIAQYVTVLAVFVGCIFSFILVAGRLATNLSFDIREAAFEKLQQLTFSYYDRKAVGWLMARLTSDCSTLSRIMGWALLDLCWGPTAIIGVGVMMFRLNWRLACIVLAVTPLLVVVARFFQVRLLLTSRALRKANSQTTAAFNEGIVGVRTTKSLVREENNLEEFTHLTGAMYSHAIRNALYQATFVPLMLSICTVGAALILWRGGLQVHTDSMSIGQLFTFLFYAGFVQWPVQELCNSITQVQAAQASAERIVSLLDAEIEIRDSGDLRDPPEQITSIEFRDVSFSYIAGQEVLKNFNLTINPGESIALVGATGGGKSTIVGLACRFYEPTSGQVLINGIDYRGLPLHWLQSHLGMVLQQPHLFSGSIKENIRYGRLNATDAEVEEAAKLVHAHEFIMELKDGYDAPVGEGGNQLSTGQKQLIALARAIIAQPQIFVMDEATSSVDTQTERTIQSAIEAVLAGRISFVIAHRLSTIRRADRILLIENGEIVEEGNHHDLLAQRGRYYDLYTNQFTHDRQEAALSEED
ncbi:MAG TPA: ABC transporter ATP-binding protein [Tepidisphaeraceae bacterium]|nr:ABC transporter ATP-binding protein [Tepidisphaeraceae bacterium]